MSERLPEQDSLTAILEGLAAAEVEQRNIDDATAKRVAEWFCAPEGSAIHRLATTGAVDYKHVTAEALINYDLADEQARRIINHLGTYCVEHGGRGDVPGWE